MKSIVQVRFPFRVKTQRKSREGKKTELAISSLGNPKIKRPIVIEGTFDFNWPETVKFELLLTVTNIHLLWYVITTTLSFGALKQVHKFHMKHLHMFKRINIKSQIMVLYRFNGTASVV
jgi:hypothetical protein